MAKMSANVKEFAVIAFTLLGVLFGMMIMTFIFASLGNSSTQSIDDVSTVVTNESLAITPATATGTINDNTNSNFVTWNATLLINQTRGPGTLTNETLVEGTDYQIFTDNGTVGNITEWNASLITYDVTRKTEVKETSESVSNNSIQSIVNYTGQADTQLLTVAIAITLVILIAVFLFFWNIFVTQKKGKAGFK